MKQKTSQKIIAAALRELARNPSSSLEQIAEAAGVSRITLFRYFSNREQLMLALHQEATRVFLEIMEPLLKAETSAAVKLHQLVEIMVPYGATFRFLLYEPYRTGDPHKERLLRDYLESLHTLVGALCAEGVLDTRLPGLWIAQHLDALLWTAWNAIDQGLLAPKSATDIILQTFYQGVGKDGVPRQ